jgi:hypothetical protein
MPFWNFQKGAVDYSFIQTFYDYDVDTGDTNQQEKLAYFAWLNKLNPDWSTFNQQVPTLSIPVMPGEKYISIPQQVTKLVFKLTAAYASTDFWWGTTVIAKYGAFGYTNRGNIGGPLSFINTDKSFWTPPDNTDNDGIYLNLQPGVSGTMEYSTLSQPQYGFSNIPPVGFATNADLLGFIGDLGGDALFSGVPVGAGPPPLPNFIP